MPGILLNFIRERQKRIINRLEWEKRKRVLHGGRIVKGRQEGAAQHEWRTTQPYDFGQRQPGKIPFFGTVPMEFTETQYRSIPAPVQAKIIPGNKPIINRRGSTVNLKPLNVSKSEIQETRRGLNFGETDQHVMATRRSSGSNWDGIVRNLPTKKTYLNTPRKAEKQKPEPSIRQDPYSFY